MIRPDFSAISQILMIEAPTLRWQKIRRTNFGHITSAMVSKLEPLLLTLTTVTKSTI